MPTDVIVEKCHFGDVRRQNLSVNPQACKKMKEIGIA